MTQGIIIDQEGEEFTKIGHLFDLKEGNKNRDKKKSALKHLQYYLQRQSTFPHLKDVKDFQKMDDITDEFVGEFATYLGKYARSYCDINKPLLAYMTAHGYLSAFKMHFEVKFREQKTPICFEPSKWKHYLSSIYKIKAEQAREGGFVSLNTLIILHN